MDANRSSNNGLRRVALFAAAVCLVLIGGFLVLDSIFPKERPLSTTAHVIEAGTGLLLIIAGTLLGRRSRRH